MNELNYATQPACQRLKDAGIVMETEKYWYKTIFDDSVYKLYNREDVTSVMKYPECLPAPTLTETLREIFKCCSSITITNDGYNLVWIEGNGNYSHSPNPADAAIDLLIWLKAKGLYK